MRRPFRLIIGAILCGVILIFIIIGHRLPFDPKASNPSEKYEHPSLFHIMGTDSLGRDIYTRVAYGSSISLFVALIAGMTSGVLGFSLGIIAGYSTQVIEEIVMRFTDIFLSVPSLFMLILFSTLIQESNLWQNNDDATFFLIINLSAISWMTIARLVYAMTLSIKSKQFIEASRALGATSSRIVITHILPNIVGPFIVALLITISDVIILETGLSFLGFGIHPRTPTLGNMIFEGTRNVSRGWWVAVFPSIALLFITVAINFLGEGIKDIIMKNDSVEYHS